jgi:predicted aconitase
MIEFNDTEKDIDFEEEFPVEPFEELELEDQEIIDYFYEEIAELGCPHCIKNMLARLYMIAFGNGENSSMLAISDSLRGIVENRG